MMGLVPLYCMETWGSPLPLHVHALRRGHVRTQREGGQVLQAGREPHQESNMPGP